MQNVGSTLDCSPKRETKSGPSQGETERALTIHETLSAVQQPTPSPSSPPEPRCICLNKALGPILICWAAFCFTANQYLFKLIAATYSASACELMMVRGLLSIVVGIVGMSYNRISPFSLSSTDGLLVSAYAFGYVIDMLFYYVGILGLNVSLACVIYCTLPIIVAILARLILGEPFAILGIVCTVVSVIGLGMAMKQPAAIFGGDNNEGSTMGIYVGFILLSGLCCALTGLVSRKIGGRISFFITTFYLGMFMALLNALILYFGSISSSFGVAKFFIIITLHLCPYFGQLAYYFAHKYAMAVTCSYYVFIQAILAFFGDLLILGISTDYIQIIGAVIVILCGGAITTQKVLTPVTPSA